MADVYDLIKRLVKIDVETHYGVALACDPIIMTYTSTGDNWNAFVMVDRYPQIMYQVYRNLGTSTQLTRWIKEDTRGDVLELDPPTFSPAEQRERNQEEIVEKMDRGMSTADIRANQARVQEQWVPKPDTSPYNS